MLILPTLIISNVRSQTFPVGFSRVKLAVFKSPADMAFAPDGRIFVAEKAGYVMVYKNGTVLPTPFYHVNAEQTDESGLSGIVLDPSFSTNNYMYIYYTSSTAPIHNTLIRVTANGDIGDSPVTLLDIEPATSTMHHGGAMAFGLDGKLYLSIGDDKTGARAQDLDTYKGKVLRLNTDGTPAIGNPFTSSEKAKYIWSYGHRNPYSISIQPGTGKIFECEVGEWTWEEINDVTASGSNFGWPSAEGNSSNPDYKNPVFIYANTHGASSDLDGCAMTGGTFLYSSSSNYPTQYQGAFFYIDFCNGWMRYLDLADGGASKAFATGLGEGLIRVKMGPDGNLYHVGTGAQQGLYKIIYSTSNMPALTGQPTSVTTSEQQPATFSVSASGANPLSYQWMKNGVNIPGATAAFYTIAKVVSVDAGKYSVTVSNTYGSVTSSEATLTVTGFNGQPIVTITSPANGAFYNAGDVINFSATASDPEDGVLTPASFTWIEEFHHSTHVHPGASLPGGATSGSFIIGKVGEVSSDQFHRLIVVVKDSKGLTDTAFVDILPVVANITLASQPSGLQVTWDGQPHTTPFSVPAVVGMTIPMGVVSPQSTNNMTNNFDNWSDGGIATHDITIPETNTTYTAIFNTATGTSELASKDNISVNVFPNPNTGSFKIDVNLGSSNTEKISIELLNALGQVVYSKKQEAVKKSIIETITLSNTLPNGIYTIKVKVGNTVNNTKICMFR